MFCYKIALSSRLVQLRGYQRRSARQPHRSKPWSDGSALKHYYFKFVSLTHRDSKAPRNAEQWWFAALFRAYCLHCRAFTVELEKRIQSQKNPCVDQSSSDEDDLESSPSSKSSSSQTKGLESLETSSEWMFTGHWYFQKFMGPCQM